MFGICAGWLFLAICTSLFAIKKLRSLHFEDVFWYITVIVYIINIPVRICKALKRAWKTVGGWLDDLAHLFGPPPPDAFFEEPLLGTMPGEFNQENVQNVQDDALPPPPPPGLDAEDTRPQPVPDTVESTQENVQNDTLSPLPPSGQDAEDSDAPTVSDTVESASAENEQTTASPAESPPPSPVVQNTRPPPIRLNRRLRQLKLDAESARTTTSRPSQTADPVIRYTRPDLRQPRHRHQVENTPEIMRTSTPPSSPPSPAPIEEPFSLMSTMPRTQRVLTKEETRLQIRLETQHAKTPSPRVKSSLELDMWLNREIGGEVAGQEVREEHGSGEEPEAEALPVEGPSSTPEAAVHEEVPPAQKAEEHSPPMATTASPPKVEEIPATQEAAASPETPLAPQPEKPRPTPRLRFTPKTNILGILITPPSKSTKRTASDPLVDVEENASSKRQVTPFMLRPADWPTLYELVLDVLRDWAVNDKRAGGVEVMEIDEIARLVESETYRLTRNYFRLDELQFCLKRAADKEHTSLVIDWRQLLPVFEKQTSPDKPDDEMTDAPAAIPPNDTSENEAMDIDDDDAPASLPPDHSIFASKFATSQTDALTDPDSEMEEAPPSQQDDKVAEERVDRSERPDEVSSTTSQPSTGNDVAMQDQPAQNQGQVATGTSAGLSITSSQLPGLPSFVPSVPQTPTQAGSGVQSSGNSNTATQFSPPSFGGILNQSTGASSSNSGTSNGPASSFFPTVFTPGAKPGTFKSSSSPSPAPVNSTQRSGLSTSPSQIPGLSTFPPSVSQSPIQGGSSMQGSYSVQTPAQTPLPNFSSVLGQSAGSANNSGIAAPPQQPLTTFNNLATTPSLKARHFTNCLLKRQSLANPTAGLADDEAIKILRSWRDMLKDISTISPALHPKASEESKKAAWNNLSGKVRMLEVVEDRRLGANNVRDYLRVLGQANPAVLKSLAGGADLYTFSDYRLMLSTLGAGASYCGSNPRLANKYNETKLMFEAVMKVLDVKEPQTSTPPVSGQPPDNSSGSSGNASGGAGMGLHGSSPLSSFTTSSGLQQSTSNAPATQPGSFQTHNSTQSAPTGTSSSGTASNTNAVSAATISDPSHGQSDQDLVRTVSDWVKHASKTVRRIVQATTVYDRKPTEAEALAKYEAIFRNTVDMSAVEKIIRDGATVNTLLQRKSRGKARLVAGSLTAGAIAYHAGLLDEAFQNFVGDQLVDAEEYENDSRFGRGVFKRASDDVDTIFSYANGLEVGDLTIPRPAATPSSQAAPPPPSTPAPNPAPGPVGKLYRAGESLESMRAFVAKTQGDIEHLRTLVEYKDSAFAGAETKSVQVQRNWNAKVFGTERLAETGMAVEIMNGCQDIRESLLTLINTCAQGEDLAYNLARGAGLFNENDFLGPTGSLLDAAQKAETDSRGNDRLWEKTNTEFLLLFKLLGKLLQSNNDAQASRTTPGPSTPPPSSGQGPTRASGATQPNSATSSQNESAAPRSQAGADTSGEGKKTSRAHSAVNKMRAFVSKTKADVGSLREATKYDGIPGLPDLAKKARVQMKWNSNVLKSQDAFNSALKMKDDSEKIRKQLAKEMDKGDQGVDMVRDVTQRSGLSSVTEFYRPVLDFLKEAAEAESKFQPVRVNDGANKDDSDRLWRQTWEEFALLVRLVRKSGASHGASQATGFQPGPSAPSSSAGQSPAAGSAGDVTQTPSSSTTTAGAGKQSQSPEDYCDELKQWVIKTKETARSVASAPDPARMFRNAVATQAANDITDEAKRTVEALKMRMAIDRATTQMIVKKAGLLDDSWVQVGSTLSLAKQNAPANGGPWKEASDSFAELQKVVKGLRKV